MRNAVLVSGAGRSGTSTLAGSLSLCGLHIPQPEVPADTSNPRGFFETQWVVDFHKALLDRSPVVRTIDSRPEAPRLLADRTHDPAALAELNGWLDQQAGHDQLIVKDPRAFWFHDLWREGVRAHGAELVFITMLRHPVEVVKSRDTYYAADRDADFRRRRATANVAGWCNVTFLVEEFTRGDRRVFMRYTDLLADWRSALAPCADRLGLDLGGALAPGEHHPVDDFIDSGLRRSQTSWDDYDMPRPLVDLAEAVWTEMSTLVDDPDAAGPQQRLDELKAEYERMHDHAVGIALDHTNASMVGARRQVRRQHAREAATAPPASLPRRAARYARRRLRRT